MTSAFDFSDLATRAKGAGLPLVEQDLKVLTPIVLSWVTDSCALSSNTIVKMLAIAVPELQTVLIGLEDKIDGVTGN